MTRTTRLLGLAMVLALLMALVSTAAGAAPDPCDRDPSHPLYPADPGDCETASSTTTVTVVPDSLGWGVSCAEYVLINDWNFGSADIREWDTSKEKKMKEISLTSGEVVCIDVSSTKRGSIEVKVDWFDPDAKKNSTLFALVKDSHPGDHCGHAVGMPGAALNLNLLNLDPESDSDGTITDIPAATLNACGTGWPESEVVCDGPACEVGDDPIVIRDKTTPDPLAFMLGITGKPGITAEVTITYKPGQ